MMKNGVLELSAAVISRGDIAAGAYPNPPSPDDER
jgi:hypothetical protein